MTKTMTAEEVQADAEQVRAAVNGAVSADETWNAGIILSRLSAQAARVPGLEEELRGAMENFDRAVSVAAGHARAHGEEIKRREQAESDRAVALAVLSEIGAPEVSGDDEVPPGVALSLAERIRRMALASQPPPAPAQGPKCSHCKGSGTDVDTDEEGGTQNETHFPCSRCKGRGLEPTPTPPPGLREAALVAAVRRVLPHLPNLDSGAIRFSEHAQAAGALREALAAYDATGGETLDKARVVEVLSEYKARFHRSDDWDRERREAIDGVASALGLTLATPLSGPGCGEKKCDTCSGRGLDEIEPGTEVECGRCEGTGEDCLVDDDAPTPTREERREALAQMMADTQAAGGYPEFDQPTTPEVVWEQDGVRVSVRPDLGVVVSHSGEPLTPAQMVSALNQAVSSLYGALAEAKREVASLRYDLQHSRQNAGMRAIEAENARLDAAADARKAAESMRERAKAAILKQQATEEDGPCSDDNGYAFNMLLRLADEVGNLPLEAP